MMASAAYTVLIIPNKTISYPAEPCLPLENTVVSSALVNLTPKYTYVQPTKVKINKSGSKFLGMRLN